MTTLKRELHSMNALTTFEAAARRLSFTRAAEELHVTQAAVSRQIQRLEQQLGVRLFHRLHRQLELTGAGRQLQQVVAAGLNDIARGIRRVRIATDAPLVTISATIGLATYWLMPRVHGFCATSPDIDIRILAGDHSVDPDGDEVDIAITYGADDRLVRPGATLLAREVVVPVCSPEYLSRRPDLAAAGPQALLGEALLHLDAEHWNRLEGSIVDWPLWFDHFNVRLTRGLKGIRTNNYPMLIEAAVAGRGIALGWRPIIDDLLDDGRLVTIGEARIEGRMGYFVLPPREREPSSAVRSVMDWLTDIASHYMRSS